MAASGRMHFGVLCATIDIANQNDIWNGITEVAAENDIHLTAYIGTYQTTDNNFYSYLDSCFDAMLGGGCLDGIILSSGFIAQNIGLDVFSRYVEKIPRDMPLVSVSLEMKGIASVVTFNKGGMYSAVEHLIQVHGKRNIAFVKGPDGHQEAEARLGGYKEALLANNLPFDERYLFPGDFGREGGRRAVAELYDVRRLPADAFVCCNDQSAVGVLQMLKDRDIMVPDDIAVVGFDGDIISSRYVPTIATVGQDFVQIGRVSAELLLRQVRGEAVEEVVRVIPEFIPRQSCGCLGKESIYTVSAIDGGSNESTFTAFAYAKFIELLGHTVPYEQIKQWADVLLDEIFCRPFNKDSFLKVFDRTLVTYYHSFSTEFSPWHKMLIMLASGIEKHKDEFQNAHAILSALTYATTLVYEIRIIEEQKKEYNLNDDRMRRRRYTNELLLMFDIDTLSAEIRKSITEMPMNTALIGIFQNAVVHGENGEGSAGRFVKTVIGFDGDDKIHLQGNRRESIHFSDYPAIGGFDFERRRREMFFFPLFSKNEEYGMMFLPYDPQIPKETYETLRINISTTLKGAQLMSTIETLSVTDELTGLLNRRGFFQFTNSRLYHLRRNDDVVPIVLFMDMDGLKLINDNYGHSEGDRAIKIFAKILKQTLREEDIIGRIGGDEFAALSSVRSKDNARQLEGRVRSAYNDYNAKGLHPYMINGSIGCVVLEEATAKCFEAAMLSADNVLYEEKLEKHNQGLTR